MNKTHEELAEAAARSIHGGDLSQSLNRRTVHIILAAITAAAQAEREQSRAVLETIREHCKLSAWNVNHDVAKLAEAELSRLSLNDSPEALSNDA
jgi:hypothetical protein